MGHIEKGWLLDDYYNERRKTVLLELQKLGVSNKLRRHISKRMVHHDRTRAAKNLMGLMRL